MAAHNVHRTGKLISHKARRHTWKMLRSESHPTPWSWVVICAVAGMTPLLIGYWQNSMRCAIYGGLAGYFMSLSDHAGPIRERTITATLALVTAWLGFLAGLYLQNYFLTFAVIGTILTYMLGLLGGKGSELERLFLFALVNYLVAFFARAVEIQDIAPITLHFTYAYLGLLAMIGISHFFPAHIAPQVLPIAEAAKQWLTKNPHRHLYSLNYSLATATAILFVEQFSIPRGYWTVITVLLLMKPDRKETLYRIGQRLFGTLIGMFFGEVILLLQLPIEALLALTAICLATVPYVWKRNYWMVSAAATVLVILLLNLGPGANGNPNLVDTSILFSRLLATLYGSVISVLVLLLFYGLETIQD